MKQEKDKRRSLLNHLPAGSAVVVTTAAAINPSRAKESAPVRRPDEVLYAGSAEFSKYYNSLRS